MRASRARCSTTVEYLLVKENLGIQNEKITQLYVIQSEKDPFLWYGVLFVDQGIYSGAVIRFNMVISGSYPNSSCPKIIFQPIPYHPLVDPDTGQLDTKNAFPEWDSNTNKLYELLAFLKRVICQPDIYIKRIQDLLEHDINHDFSQTRSQTRPQSSSEDSHRKNVKDQAAETAQSHRSSDRVNVEDLFMHFEHSLSCIRTYETNPEEFRRQVDNFKLKCSHQLFDKPIGCEDDKNALVFSLWDSEQHEPIRSCVLQGRFTPTNLYASYHKETDSVSFVPGSELS